MSKKVSVLFVCLGNICRSPTAHAVFEGYVNKAQLNEAITVDSAGTAAFHVGSQPDARSMATAKKRGYPMSHLRARKAITQDFYDFDYIFAMDRANLADLQQLQGQVDSSAKAQLHLFLPFLDSQVDETEVPDPYYGGEAGFEHVFDLVEAASDRLLGYLQKEHGL